MSWSSMLPGALVTVRTRPDSVAANTAWSVPAVLPPPPEALNHTSSPPGVQCAPKRSSQPVDIVVFVPARSTTATSPRLSIATGCSKKATRSPFGDTLTSLSQPCAR
jgi:hypothetical protein